MTQSQPTSFNIFTDIQTYFDEFPLDISVETDKQILQNNVQTFFEVRANIEHKKLFLKNSQHYADLLYIFFHPHLEMLIALIKHTAHMPKRYLQIIYQLTHQYYEDTQFQLE